MNRDLASGLGWSTAGALLCSPLVSAYAGQGPLSRTTALSGVRVLRDTGLSGLMPPGSAYLLLLVPAAGLGLLGTAAWSFNDRWRLGLLLLALAGTLLIALPLGLTDPRDWGTALWLTVLGLIIGTTTLVLTGRRSPERNHT